MNKSTLIAATLALLALYVLHYVEVKYELSYVVQTRFIGTVLLSILLIYVIRKGIAYKTMPGILFLVVLTLLFLRSVVPLLAFILNIALFRIPGFITVAFSVMGFFIAPKFSLISLVVLSLSLVGVSVWGISIKK
ncbi:MAG: hypothetical protein AB6733_00325 [Clostridiaceae bacterium]